MAFITYAFLGLCLPMVALCSLCCFPSKMMMKVDTPYGGNAERTLVMDTDNGWATELGGNGVWLVYDLNTQTGYSISQGKCSPTGFTDYLSQVPCIPTGAATVATSDDQFNTYRLVTGYPWAEISQEYKAKDNGDGKCTPVSADFILMNMSKTSVRYLGQADLDKDYEEYKRVNKFVSDFWREKKRKAEKQLEKKCAGRNE